jgi:hypothetical protein
MPSSSQHRRTTRTSQTAAYDEVDNEPPTQHVIARDRQDRPSDSQQSPEAPPEYIFIPSITNGHGLRALSSPPPGQKPGYAKRVLIRAAIEGSPQQKLRLQDIYEAVEERFEYYRNVSNDADSWK